MNEGKFQNLDADSTVFFTRELEHIKSKTYDIVKAPLRAFELIPVDNTVGTGAESIVYQQYDAVGIAKIISNYADDLPRADVVGKEFVGKIKSIGDSYGYSLQDIRAAQYAGKPLQQRKATAALRAQQEKWNQIAFYGDAEHGLPGWLTNANIPSVSAPADGTGSATTFASKTPAQILRDLNSLANSIITLTKGAEKPNTLVLPIAQYTLITTTVYGTASDTTIAEMFLKNSPFINRIEWADELSAATLAANGVTDFTGNIAIAYNADPDKFTFEMPQFFEQLPVQERGLEYIVPCHSRVGGVLIYYPLSMSILEGI
jgi:hypothetical protein